MVKQAGVRPGGQHRAHPKARPTWTHTEGGHVAVWGPACHMAGLASTHTGPRGGTGCCPRPDTAGEAGDLSWVKFPELKCWSFVLKVVNRKAKILCV